MMDNMKLWNKFKETDPKYTKRFKRSGGFSGTATDPMYIVMRMTEEFGPNGWGWGWEILDEAYVEGAPLKKNDQVKTIIHKILLRLWYKDGEDIRKTSPQFGLTTFVGEYSTAGIYTDEEHAKKSVTDAISKCAVQLGIAADIHMGKYDDNKYVKSLHDKYDGKKEAPQDTSKAGVDDIPLGDSKKIPKQKAGVLYAKLKAVVKKKLWNEEDELGFMDDIGFDSVYEVTEEKFESINKTLTGMLEG